MDVARKIRATTFTLPPTVTARIVKCAAEEEYTENESEDEAATETDRNAWRKRNQFLGRLCLVSKAFQLSAISFIYQDIRIYLDRELAALSSLISTLKASAGAATTSKRNYGSYSKSLVICTGSRQYSAVDIEKVSVGFLALLRLLPALTSTVITRAVADSANLAPISVTLVDRDITIYPSLTSIHLVGLDISTLFSWLPILQQVHGLQQLYFLFIQESHTTFIPEDARRKSFLSQAFEHSLYKRSIYLGASALRGEKLLTS
jgi:hypothetical protein